MYIIPSRTGRVIIIADPIATRAISYGQSWGSILKGSMKMEKVNEIIASYDGDKSALISILQDVQAEYNWLPPDVLAQIAHKMGVSLTELFGIVTFYKAFRLKPRGKHLMTVCLGTACHVRGAPRILEEFKRRLLIKENETTPDNTFTLETVNCLGCCALGPIAVVDGEYRGQMTKTKVNALIEELRRAEGVRGDEEVKTS